MAEAREPPHLILSKAYTLKGSYISKEQEDKEKFFITWFSNAYAHMHVSNPNKFIYGDKMQEWDYSYTLH